MCVYIYIHVCFEMFILIMQRYSLMKAAVNAVVVEAFDINDAANDVYEHNFGHRPYQVCIYLQNSKFIPFPLTCRI